MMLGGKLHTKTTKIHGFFLFESRQTTFYTRVLKVYINFQRKKKNFKKITKINDIIPLTILTEMWGKQLFIFFYEEVERTKPTIVPSDSLPMEDGNVKSDQRSLTIWINRHHHMTVSIKLQERLYTSNKGRSVQEILLCKRCCRLGQLWNKTSCNKTTSGGFDAINYTCKCD